MVEFAAPQFTQKHPTTEHLWMDCPREEEEESLRRKAKPNAYEAIYVKELKKLMEDNKMVGLYHFNSVTNRNYRKVILSTKCTYSAILVTFALTDCLFK